ncbi:MAG: STAS domain-containing protein, partial [Phycisphaerae bacterium]|nr:STAS domain-containing protein [Phycisphaerae bacterium]
IHVSVSDGVTVVTLASQKILDEVSIARLGEDLGTLVGKSPNPKLVIDFVNVTNMSSSALGMLITLHKRVREASGRLRLCNIQPNIMEVFRITRLEEIFDIYQSQHEATDGLK